MKKKIILPILTVLLIFMGAFIGWLIYDAYDENNDNNINYADIDSMIQSNADTAFEFLSKESDSLPDMLNGYIIDTEKDMTDSASEVFSKVDAIEPNTVLIRYDEEKLSSLITEAQTQGLSVIIILPEDMLSTNELLSVYEAFGVSFICVETDNIQKTEEIHDELTENDIMLGIYVGETLSDELKSSVEASKLDFYFVQIDSTLSDNAESIINAWSQSALKSQSKVCAVLRNDKVTDSNADEIPSLVKLTYSYGGFSGCIIYDREKLSTDDHQTATYLYSYYEYFNNPSYTALTITDFKLSDDHTSVQFSGTSDITYPVHIWCSADSSWTTASSQGDDGSFTVDIKLIEGKNKLVIKHKNAMYTYYIDRVTDVMTAYEAVINDDKVILTATAKNGSSVYASVANTYLVELEKTAENGEYAEYYGEYELTRELKALTSSQVSFAAEYNGLTDIAMCNETQTEISPYTDNGLGRADFCLVTKDYAETTSTAAEDDSSDPTCTPQLAGSYGIVSSYLVSDNNVICVTATGMKIYMSDTRLILDGYTLPENNINLDSVSTDNETVLTFTPTYPTFVKFVEAPQDYYVGYLQRIYNVSEFTAEYVDIMFMDMNTCSHTSEPDFSNSQIISSYEWYTNTQTNTITLRLYLKEKGAFYGYSYSVDNGKITISFKNGTSSLSGTVIMLDPGHGGYGNPGTNYGMSTYEEEITYSITTKAAQKLRENGATVIVTRSDSQALTLSQRVDMARAASPDIFVSIHCDGSEYTSWMGTHTFYYRSYSMPLAASIHSQIVNAYRQYYYTDSASDEYTNVDMGVKFYPFMVTRIEECPSVLVECGYLTNDIDAQFLMSDGGQEVIATAIAQGITDYIVNY